MDVLQNNYVYAFASIFRIKKKNKIKRFKATIIMMSSLYNKPTLRILLFIIKESFFLRKNE